MSEDEKIIHFPTDRIVRRNDKIETVDPKAAEKLRDQQTKQFVETAVDDISMNLLKQLYDLAVKTDKASFTKDLAIIVDLIRGLIYRDFGMKHPSQQLSDKMVSLNILKDGTQTAKINYSLILEKIKDTKPLSKDFKNELKDLNDQAGLFEGDDLDD